MSGTISSTIFINSIDAELQRDYIMRCAKERVVMNLANKIAKAALIRIEEGYGEDGEIAVSAYIATTGKPILSLDTGENPGFIPLQITQNAEEIFDDTFRAQVDLRNAQKEIQSLKGRLHRALVMLGEESLKDRL